jgi:Flp pilus assembly protein TadG
VSLRRNGRGDRGTAIVEFVWLALLLLVPLLYIVLAVFDTQRAAYAASAAARSASRAFVTAPDPETAYARADAAARLAFGDQGIDSAGFSLTISCRPDPRHCLTPGSVVSAEVHSAADLPLMPPVLGDNKPRIAVAAVHRSPYGTFREARP